MLLQREKYLFAEVLIPQITNKLGSANPQSVTFAEGQQIFKSAKLPICDLRNLFADRPSFA
jgi:hypothetical protein